MYRYLREVCLNPVDHPGLTLGSLQQLQHKAHSYSIRIKKNIKYQKLPKALVNLKIPVRYIIWNAPFGIRQRHCFSNPPFLKLLSSWKKNVFKISGRKRNRLNPYQDYRLDSGSNEYRYRYGSETMLTTWTWRQYLKRFKIKKRNLALLKLNEVKNVLTIWILHHINLYYKLCRQKPYRYR